MDPSTLIHAASLSTSRLTSGAPPTASTAPTELSDAELLSATRGLVGRSNQLLAELLAHLAEVEARGIHRTRACSSLYAYCLYELRFSEDEAFRRVAAARLIRRFPALLDALASGELHLTGLLMLGPHLTEANLTEVLVRAKHRTKRELARLVRVLDPLPRFRLASSRSDPRQRVRFQRIRLGRDSCSPFARSANSRPVKGRVTGWGTRTTRAPAPSKRATP